MYQSYFVANVVPIIQSIIMLLGLASVVLLWLQIRQVHVWNKIKSEYNFVNVERLEVLERRVVDECYRLGIDLQNIFVPLNKDQTEAIWNDRECRNAVKYLLSHFENVCSAINVGNAHEDLSFSVHEGALERLCKTFEEYLKRATDNYHDKNAYVELRNTRERWQKKRSSFEAKEEKIRLKLEKKMRNKQGVKKGV